MAVSNICLHCHAIGPQCSSSDGSFFSVTVDNSYESALTHVSSGTLPADAISATRE
jgi:hypothetical protein